MFIDIRFLSPDSSCILEKVVGRAVRKRGGQNGFAPSDAALEEEGGGGGVAAISRFTSYTTAGSSFSCATYYDMMESTTAVCR